MNKQQLLKKLLWQYQLIQFFSWFSALVFILILLVLVYYYAKKKKKTNKLAQAKGLVSLIGWATLISFIGWIVFASLWSVWGTAAEMVKYL